MILKWQLRTTGLIFILICFLLANGCKEPSIYKPREPVLPISTMKEGDFIFTGRSMMIIS